MLLTDEERRKFAKYLREDAHSNDLIAQQAAKLPNLEAIIKSKRVLAAAETIVAKMLEECESMTISGETPEV